jgi:hypothetical protein
MWGILFLIWSSGAIVEYFAIRYCEKRISALSGRAFFNAWEKVFFVFASWIAVWPTTQVANQYEKQHLANKALMESLLELSDMMNKYFEAAKTKGNSRD